MGDRVIKPVLVELWRVHVDDGRLVVDRGGLRSCAGPVGDAETVDGVVRAEVAAGPDDGTPVELHSTSWRESGPGVLLTYIGLFRKPDRDGDWVLLSDHLESGLSEEHKGVLLHALRHVAFLVREDDEARERIVTACGTGFLEGVLPGLAGQYREHLRSVRRARR